ncbi:hypothetical protein PFY12_03505 [Chryseobacterium camelliae]|uniref:Glycosyltransferase RgtA/B/C/D-like domain-containing protein n=1 Tax=Chryseobacterium camelliae TaxID=1265445 RepID=A0ABY7QNJ9_9FLAO|nr:hypothetical protein [Chryseobacterium camelliae]WBV61192.1 hypothetical protein PFY12_03505 [Chryseobacterium camelliae]
MKLKEKNIQILLVIITVMVTILRFLLNEKGRVSPDSIRYMKFAHVLPEIDNTITPLGYPLSIKIFTFLGTDEFWASKIVGISAMLFIVFFAWKKNFYSRESTVLVALFSFVSIFAATLSEAFILPFVLLFLYAADTIIKEKLKGWKAVFYLSMSLILLYNVRYSALFMMGATGLYGLLFIKRSYGRAFLFSGIISGIYIILYKFLFIDYFNEDYIQQSLEMGLYPTSKLLPELFQGLATTFNPFIHMSDPGGGMINYGIYGLGVLNILVMVFLFTRYKLTNTEFFFVFTGISGIICSFFIQYFYPVDPIGYRLLAPFSFPLWLVYFRKLFQLFNVKVYAIGIVSIMSGVFFTWLSKGNYLENRKEVTRFLQSENLDKVPLQFYLKTMEDLEKMQTAELISTVNSNIEITFKASDTLKKTTLTYYKVSQKIKIDKNKYQ